MTQALCLGFGDSFGGSTSFAVVLVHVVIMAEGFGVVPSRWPKSWTPFRIGTTCVFHRRKLERVSLQEIAVAMVEDLTGADIVGERR